LAAGYTHTFCTPLVWPTFSERLFRPTFAKWVDALPRDLDSAGIPLKLLPGGEHNFFTAKFLNSPEDQCLSSAMAGKYVLGDLGRSDS